MLKTFNKQWKNVEFVLNESGQEQRYLVDVNWTVIEILIKFWTFFQTITNVRQADKLPTIHEVYQCCHFCIAPPFVVGLLILLDLFF